MSARPVRIVEQARTIAGWLEGRGHFHEAEIIRAVCRSNDTYRGTLSQLHADNMALRREFQGRED